VLSAYAKAGHISHQLNSHVSLVRFCQRIFNLPALNPRDGSSNAMSDCFDLSRRPLSPLQ
jgi:phospholipase C